MEIGANTRDTLDRELLPLAPSAFLLSFEPLLDKYAALIVRAQRCNLRPLREPSPALRQPRVHRQECVMSGVVPWQARNSRPDTRTRLGFHHPRGMVLPFAVSGEANSVREFKISGRTDGCASLLDPVHLWHALHRSAPSLLYICCGTQPHAAWPRVLLSSCCSLDCTCTQAPMCPCRCLRTTLSTAPTLRVSSSGVPCHL